MNGELMMVRAAVGMMSLVGVHGEAPHAWGNYFSLAYTDLRVLNFWAENLEAAVQQGFLHDGQVQVRAWEWETPHGKRKACIIEDERIPKDWYYNKLCFTGGPWPPMEIAKQMYEILGDPDNEFEQFTDPELYHARRGGIWNPRGFIFKSLGLDAKTSEELVQAVLKKRVLH